MAIIEVNSAFQAVDGENGRTIVNFSKLKGPEAWDKMDEVINHLSEFGWIVIDHRCEPAEKEESK
jgi:hypothetical protein